MTTVAAGLEPIAPISEPQKQALYDAETAARRFAFAPKLATWNGVGMLLGAALSLVLAVFDHALLLSAVVLGVCGWVELSAGKKSTSPLRVTVFHAGAKSHPTRSARAHTPRIAGYNRVTIFPT